VKRLSLSVLAILMSQYFHDMRISLFSRIRTLTIISLLLSGFVATVDGGSEIDEAPKSPGHSLCAAAAPFGLAEGDDQIISDYSEAPESRKTWARRADFQSLRAIFLAINGEKITIANRLIL
jgi:hypothetical protein